MHIDGIELPWVFSISGKEYSPVDGSKQLISIGLIIPSRVLADKSIPIHERAQHISKVEVRLQQATLLRQLF